MQTKICFMVLGTWLSGVGKVYKILLKKFVRTLDGRQKLINLLLISKNPESIMNIRRLSKICCVRVLSVAENESVGRPVQNFVGFFKIIKIRLLQSVISSGGHSKMRRYALNGGGEPKNAHNNVRGRGCSLKSVRMPMNCSKSVFSQCSLIFLSVA